MNTFSIEVSKALKAIGVEGDLKKSDNWREGCLWWSEPASEDAKQFTKTFISSGTGWGDKGDYITFPAYTLVDVIRLMPKIGEVMEWGKEKDFYHYEEDEHESILGGVFWSKVEYHSHEILDEFLRADYPAAETYLLSLIEKANSK